MTEPSGRTDLFAYNSLGLREHTWNGTIGGGTYNGNSFVAPSAFVIHTLQQFDSAGRLIRIKTTRGSSDTDAFRLSDLSYSYAVPVGTICPNAQADKKTDQRQNVTDNLTDKLTNYCYNAMGNLTKAATDNGGPTYDYGWDFNSNRKTDEAGNHAFNDGDQLIGTGYAHDANGNQTASPAYPSASYNGIDQTTSITPLGGSAVPFDYAGSGQSERTLAGTTTAQNGSLGVQTETTGGQTTGYVRDAGGSLVYQNSPSGQFYYYFDGQGSVIGLVDTAGNQRAKYSYDPFGAHATAEGVNGTLPANPWRWNGGYLDSTGLYHFGERYYDPMLGRFLQADPIMGGSCNAYDYACGDPINMSDISGLATRRACSGKGDCLRADAKFIFDANMEFWPNAFSVNSSTCYVIACSTQSSSGDSIEGGLGSKGRRGTTSISQAYYVTFGDPSKDGSTGMGCWIYCIGGYRNDDGGFGVSVGFGTPSVFVGRTKKVGN